MYHEKEHAYRQFAKDLKNDGFKNLIILYGKEEYLIKWAIDSLVNKYIEKSARIMDLVVIDEDEPHEGDLSNTIIEACETFSLFSPKRIVIVNDFKCLASESVKGCDIEKLSEYMTHIPEHTMLIFTGSAVDKRKKLTKALMKNGSSYEFDSLSRNELIAFAAKRIRNAGLSISDRLLSYLVDGTGYFNQESEYDLYMFDSDIAKLIALAKTKNIEEKDISDAVISDRESFIFDLLDSIGDDKKGRSFTLLHNIMDGESDAMRIIAVIVSQFELMLSVKDVTEKLGVRKSEQIASMIGANAYRIKKMLPYAGRFSAKEIKTILKSAYECDKKIKTGLLKPGLALELFVASVSYR